MNKLLIIITLLSCLGCYNEEVDPFAPFIDYIEVMESKTQSTNYKTKDFSDFCQVFNITYTGGASYIPEPTEVFTNGGLDCVGLAILARDVIMDEFQYYIIAVNDDYSSQHAIGLYKDSEGYYITNNTIIERIEAEDGYISLKSLSIYNTFISKKKILTK